MRKYFILLILLTPFLLAGSIHQKFMVIIGQNNSGGVVAPTYLYTEDAESGAQTWGGDSDNEIAFTVIKGTCDADEKGTVLEGSESIEFIDGGATECRIESPDLTTGDGNIYFAFHVKTPQGEGEVWYPIKIETSGGDCIATWYLNWSGGTNKWNVRLYYDDSDDGTCNATPGSSGYIFDPETEYLIQVMVNNASEISFEYSTLPFSSWTTVANGSIVSADVEDSQPQQMQFDGVNNSPHFIDDIRVDNESINY